MKPGHRIAWLDAPEGFATLVGPLPEGATVAAAPTHPPYDVIHVFTKSRKSLEASIGGLVEGLHPDGSLWISWPKKSSGVPTDVTEDILRRIVLPRGLVDNKVCAVDETWSALRIVWRRELRPSSKNKK
ncbi:MAG: DUF3052 domain-containing protein [Deltaproteobacteria bacterium]|nr:DUF3052 domain-containing protein [Deltaproteobacteria bacterium]